MVGARIVVNKHASLHALCERIKFNGGAILPRDSHDKTTDTVSCCGLNADTVEDIRKHPDVEKIDLFDDHEEQVYM